MVCGIVTWAKLCTVTAFQREKKRKRKIMKRRRQLSKAKGCLKNISMKMVKNFSEYETDDCPTLKELSKMAVINYTE